MGSRRELMQKRQARRQALGLAVGRPPGAAPARVQPAGPDPEDLTFDTIAQAKEAKATRLAERIGERRTEHAQEIADLKARQADELAGLKKQQRQAELEAKEFRRVARRISGRADTPAAGATHQPTWPEQILAHMAAAPAGARFTVPELDKALGGGAKSTIAASLHNMLVAGTVKRPERGVYVLATRKGKAA